MNIGKAKVMCLLQFLDEIVHLGKMLNTAVI